MPFNGSGVFSIVNTFVPGTTIFSSAVNANFTDIATGLSSTVLKNGTQTITANIPMSGFGFTGVGQIASQAVITVSSAATTDILAQLSLLVAISGTATITSFGADAASRRNQIKFVRATGAFTITYNVTSMITPTAANIVCAAGDTFVVISDASSNCRIYAFQRASGYPVISYPGFRNIARRNGGLEVWQRGAGGAASFAVPALSTTGIYTADGWYLATQANEACVVSQQAGLTDSSQWSAKIIRNSGQTGTALIFIGFPLDTDEIYPVLGQFVRLSFTAKAGANFSAASGILTVNLKAGTGTPVRFAVGFTGSSDVLGINATLTTTATRFQVSSAAVVPIATRQLEIIFGFTPVGTAGGDDSFYVDDVQLEIVPDASQGASPFERLNFQEQLTLCKRHYQKSFAYNVAPAQNSGATTAVLLWTAISTTRPNFYYWWWPVAIRLITGATVTTYNPSASNAEIRNATDAADFTSSSGTQASDTVAVLTGTVNAGFGASDTIMVHATVDAGI